MRAAGTAELAPLYKCQIATGPGQRANMGQVYGSNNLLLPMASIASASQARKENARNEF